MNLDLSNISGGVVDLGGQTVSGLVLSGRVFDPANPVVIRNGTIAGWKLTGCANIEFSGVQFQRGASYYAMLVSGGGNITVENFDLDGSGSGSSDKALEFVNTKGVTLADGDMHHFNIGVAFRSCDAVELLRSDFHDFSEDCIRLVSVQGGLIEACEFTDFSLVASGAGIHPDAIQTFMENGRQNKDITIRRNLIWRGKGGPYQGIFIKPLAGIAPTGVVIEENIILGTLKNALITYGESQVRDNVVGDMDGSLPHISWSGQNVSLTGNTAPKYTDTAIGFKTPVPAGNWLNSFVMVPGDAQALADAWRAKYRAALPAPAPEPVPAPTPEPAPAPVPEPTPTEPPVVVAPAPVEPAPAPEPAPVEPAPIPVPDVPPPPAVPPLTAEQKAMVLSAVAAALDGVG